MSDKLKNLEKAFLDIEKKYGKGAIVKLGEKSTRKDIDVIPTGAFVIDNALGIGGVPRGRIVEIYGPESSGKTTLTLHIIAEAQKLGGKAVFIDAEHALDPIYAAALGVDLDELIVSQPDSGEQALEICEEIIKSGAVDLVVVDSVAALTPRAELEGEMGDSHMGLQARLMGQALRKLTAHIGRTQTCLIFINQLRDKIGGYGLSETTTGGKALKFYASVRMDIRRGEQIKDGTEVIGNNTKLRVVKNKLAPPFKSVTFDILYGEGISNESGLIDLAVEHGIIQKAGSWFSYGEERLGQGKDNVRRLLVENEKLTKEIEAKVKQAIKEQAEAPKTKGKRGAKAVAPKSEEPSDEPNTPDEAETDTPKADTKEKPKSTKSKK
ncbi:MAG: recombinase RecA [Firmicutes bacterium]|nr:recombinase RecA [Bacillota bacterium]